MNISYAELALIMGGVMALLRLIEKGFEFLYKFITKNGNGKTDQSQNVDLALLKERVKRHEDEIYLVMTNHIPHIKDDIGEIKIMMGRICQKLDIK